MADAIRAQVLPALKLAFEEGRVDDALAFLDELLARELPRETRCAALAYRSMVCRHGERYEDELRDLRAAHEISEPDSYRRYGIELGLGMNAGKRGDDDCRARWLEQAETTLRAVPIHERPGTSVDD